MHLAFLADPLHSFKTYKDSTFAMMREAAARGHVLYAFEQCDMRGLAGRVSADVRRIELTGDAHDWFAASPVQARELTSFDAVIMRKDPPFDSEYLYATHLLEQAERQGARVFNKPRALRDFNEKLAILRFPQFIAPTLVSSRADDIRAFLQEHQDIILKPLDGMGGAGIFRLRPEDPNIGVILETQTLHGKVTLMAQRYLPAIKEGDKRILVIAGKPVEWCLARIPMQGETRGNLAAGGTGVARQLTERDREIADTLGPQFVAEGLLLVGLDVIGDTLTEVNVTSPTCFQEISAQSGINVAGVFIDALEVAI
ncbi:glutathione synthase [Chitinimonas sp. BJB300]|uniref:glutathione synthase n=1 Tax=Chitinimonas sp. BJB300 TaxID=1559339 RepID=UPI000C106D5A|nr:glutathione synthase [Chitinimonas sp. BJB300]PHV12512.1 glutathione synthase [Chitinimonas sp. BJB300]TSJ91138.1 glutathione synthase [Chitinimonas sp. BJB300]